MDRQKIKEKVISLIEHRTEVKDISENSRFKDDLIFDSLDEIEITMDFEEEFGIAINDEEISRIYTVGEAIDFLEDRICRKSVKTKS